MSDSLGNKVTGGDGRTYQDRYNDGRYFEVMGPGKGSGSGPHSRKEVDAGPARTRPRRSERDHGAER